MAESLAEKCLRLAANLTDAELVGMTEQEITDVRRTLKAAGLSLQLLMAEREALTSERRG